MAHSRQPAAVLTSYGKSDSIDMYMSEVRSIRQSRVFQLPDPDENGEEEG